MRPSLPTVTLSMMATVDHKAAAYAFNKTSEMMAFGNRVVFTDQPKWFPSDVIHVPIAPFEDYHKICVWGLTQAPAMILQHMLSHALCIHWDSPVLNPGIWTNEFLAYDYIGAVMGGWVVGNGGFMLASRKFYECVQQLEIPATVEACHPSDQIVCIRHRSTMEYLGCKFAPIEVANKFSRENDPPYGTDVLGGHGKLYIADLVRQGRY